MTSPPLPQVPAEETQEEEEGKKKAQQQRVYQRPARDAIQVRSLPLALRLPLRSTGSGCLSRPCCENADMFVLLQIVDALKTSEGASTPYIVYCIVFEVRFPLLNAFYCS